MTPTGIRGRRVEHDGPLAMNELTRTPMGFVDQDQQHLCKTSVDWASCQKNNAVDLQLQRNLVTHTLRRWHISDFCCLEGHKLTHERPIRSVLIRTGTRPELTCHLGHGVSWYRAAYAHSAMGEMQSAIGLTNAWTHVCASIYMKCGFENSELWGSAKLGNADIFVRANVTPLAYAQSRLLVTLTIIDKDYGTIVGELNARAVILHRIRSEHSFAPPTVPPHVNIHLHTTALGLHRSLAILRDLLTFIMPWQFLTPT